MKTFEGRSHTRSSSTLSLGTPGKSLQQWFGSFLRSEVGKEQVKTRRRWHFYPTELAITDGDLLSTAGKTARGVLRKTFLEHRSIFFNIGVHVDQMGAERSEQWFRTLPTNAPGGDLPWGA